MQIRVWGRSEEKLKKCVDDIKAAQDSDIPVTAYPVLSDAVSGADVVATVTMSSEPVLHGEWLKPGALVCCKHLYFKFCKNNFYHRCELSRDCNFNYLLVTCVFTCMNSDNTLI